MRIRRAARTLASVSFLTALVGLAPVLKAGEPVQAPVKPAATAKPDDKPSGVKAGSAPSVGKSTASKGSPKGATSKGASSKPKKSAGKRPALPRKPGSGAGEPDEATRRIIAGPGAGRGKPIESAELRSMRELDLVLFPGRTPSAATPWPAAGALEPARDQPKLFASGMPPSSELATAPADAALPLGWLKQLNKPDIPMRWDARVVRYLEFYKTNPRGRSMVAGWIKKSGRYGSAIRRTLREHNVPEDILWLALVESGFDPTIESPAGAAGLWQFMPEGARIYGLTVDRWVDERLDPERSTVAAARYLSDLRQRFGSWELAFAAYNMGYGGLLSAIRKYNTNDFWELSKLEAGIPFETALYVPKIVAMAVVSRNTTVFGCDGVELDAPVAFEKVAVGSGVSLKTIAAAAGTSQGDIDKLNPQLLAGRTPPIAPGMRDDATWSLRVPSGASSRVAQNLPKQADEKLERYLVRWGESLDDIASVRKATKNSLQALNGLKPGEVVRPGTVLFVPATPGVGAAAAANLLAEGASARPVVVVPPQAAAYPDRKRVFYRVVPGDTLRDVANVLAVTADQLCHWNSIDPTASLHEGMTLQAFVPSSHRLTSVAVLDEKNARVLTVGTPEFFAYFEGQKGRKRVELVAKDGDTWKSLAKRYGLSVGMIERINQRARTSQLNPGDKVVVYVPDTAAPPIPPEKANDVAVAGFKPAGDTGGKDDETKPALLRNGSDLYDDEPERASPEKPSSQRSLHPLAPAR
jgi:membrane-bound lytic murein transglycosylase D